MKDRNTRVSNSHSKKETWLGKKLKRIDESYVKTCIFTCYPWSLDDFDCLEKQKNVSIPTRLDA